MYTIVIAGIKRSGSTAQYNMVRLLCEAVYREINVTGSPYSLKRGVNIVKKHEFDDYLFRTADIIFTTDRDDTEIEESLKRFEHVPDMSMEQMRVDLDKWKIRSFHQHYELIKNDPSKAIQQIAKQLNLKVNPLIILDQFNEVKPREEYDPKTFLFPNHITK